MNSEHELRTWTQKWIQNMNSEHELRAWTQRMISEHESSLVIFTDLSKQR